jgi:uncharacterized protein YggU (UPF0235/DUF167 family)
MKQLTISAKVKTHAKDRGLDIDERDVYQIRTPLAPDKGRANADVIAILAKHFKTSKGSVTIVKGITRNKKIIKILTR